LGGECGLPANLVLPTSSGTPEAQVARYCLISAAKIITSHDPLRGFAPRPNYPAEVQERRYDADVREQAKVERIAGALNPALIFNTSPSVVDGTPVLTEEGIALGGNGRGMGIQLYYSRGGQSPKEYLIGHAGEFGFTADQVANVPDPAVVRVIQTGTKELDPSEKRRRLRQLVRLLNVPLTQEMDPRTNAVALARQLDDGVFDVLATGLDADTTLAEFLGSRASDRLTQQLYRVGVLSDRNVGRYIVHGIYTDEGKRLVERMFAASLLPDASLLDALGEQMQSTLARGAPYLLAASSFGQEWDLRPLVPAVARDVIAMQRSGAHTVTEFLSQDALFRQEAPQSTGLPLGKGFLAVAWQLRASPLKFARFARSFAADARGNQAGQGGLFAAEKITPDLALHRAANSVEVIIS
jgi:hypothetical protein